MSVSPSGRNPVTVELLSAPRPTCRASGTWRVRPAPAPFLLRLWDPALWIAPVQNVSDAVLAPLTSVRRRQYPLSVQCCRHLGQRVARGASPRHSASGLPHRVRRPAASHAALTSGGDSSATCG